MIIIGCLLLVVSIAAHVARIEHPELFREAPFVGLFAIAIGILERGKAVK
jgi:hypothetical protein